MAKPKTIFYCRNCGTQSGKWLGRCPSCGEWNSFDEEVIHRTEKAGPRRPASPGSAKPRLIKDIESSGTKRIDTGNQELNRVLGGGLVAGSITLVGGEPGIGKSTLMLQMALQMPSCKVLYVSGEESGEQIKMRADRISTNPSECYILTETLTDQIMNHIDSIEPQLVIIDSIQTLQSSSIESSAGSISQIRECASELQQYAKTSGVPVILIGHITKDGAIAGPKVLEHMVDTVLQFEGERNYGYRILRGAKNRFGPASELGIFQMQGNGLREVSNPSEIMLTRHDEAVSGITLAATIEGLRPMMIEIQALVSSSAYGTPQRSATGIDGRRLSMLLAVIEKRAGFRLGPKDVFLNIAGGMRIDDPATDLAIAVAIISSSEDMPVDSKICFAAEIGLSGEIRQVNRIEQRMAEAARLGYETIIISRYNARLDALPDLGIKVVALTKIEEVIRYLFA
ncbi:MAG: DNA repair protein RadA [Bacteroidetes bacterium HGW-Bacteroidetes-22]|nr:MAG: DNA repair protein RadA [Bacteroidetes bacterium HGW-Bacteroidetes-22]